MSPSVNDKLSTIFVHYSKLPGFAETFLTAKRAAQNVLIVGWPWEEGDVFYTLTDGTTKPVDLTHLVSAEMIKRAKDHEANDDFVAVLLVCDELVVAIEAAIDDANGGPTRCRTGF